MRDPIRAGRERYVAFLAERGITVVAVDTSALQSGFSDCGVAALETALVATGLRVPPRADLANRLELGHFGVTLTAIHRVARELGVSATLTRGRTDDLPAVNSVALLKYRHFVVIRSADTSFVRVFDPLVGELRFPKEVFEQQWSGKSVQFPSS